MPRGDKSRYTDKQKRKAEHRRRLRRSRSPQEEAQRALGDVSATDRQEKRFGRGKKQPAQKKAVVWAHAARPRRAFRARQRRRLAPAHGK